jgi:hypothetical protein
MSKEYQEPEEMELNNTNDAVILDDFNPLDEAVIEKEYTKPNVKINPSDFAGDIPEPDFMPPPMNPIVSIDEKKQEFKPKEPFNPQVKQMSNKDKRMGSKRVAEMLMTAYKWVNQFADAGLQFNERKIAKMQMEGEIDLTVNIPVSPTDSMTAGEFIQEFNNQSKGTITVTKEFEEEVMPVLIDVLEEEGITVTKKQELAFLVGKDIAVKGFMAYQSIQVKKDTLKMIQELGKANVGYAQTVAPAPPPPQPAQPQYQPEYREQPQPTYTPTADFNPELNVNDFVNQMTGGIDPNAFQPQPEVEAEIPEPTFETETYTEPTPTVKIISEGTKKSRRGRPKTK